MQQLNSTSNNTHASPVHMASPSVSTSTFNFVKKYPIVLCGFSLLFMPSVHRLLLYFTPLLLSTAIFIVAMMSWGPSSSSEKGRRRSKKKLGTHQEYQAFHGSFKMNDHEEEEEEDEEEVEDEEVEAEELHMQQEEISQKGNAAIKDYVQHEYISQNRKTGCINAEPDPDLKRQVVEEREPDPDLAAEEGNRVGTVSNEAAFTLQYCGGQAEPDPDLQTDCAGAAFSGRGSSVLLGSQAERPDPDLRVGTASNPGSAEPHAESDPDLHAEPDLQLQNCPAADQLAHQHDAPPSAAASDLHAQHAQTNLDQPSAVPYQDLDQHAEESADDDHQLYAGSDNTAEQEGDLPAVVQPKLKGVIRKAPCTAASDDPHDMEFAAARAAVERLEASLGISGSSSHQRAPEYCLQAPLHAAA